MKKNFSIILVLSATVLLSIFSCKNYEGTDPVQNDVLKRYLEIKSKVSEFQLNNNQSNLEFVGASIVKQFKKGFKSGSDSIVPDSAITDTSYWQNWTCALVNEFIDDDGNNVTVYDYGEEGCQNWGSLIKGKVTYIWSQKADKYYSKVLYENYSAYGMTMNGYSEYTYKFNTMPMPSDTSYIINWSGSAICYDNIEMSYGSETYIYTSNYSTEWDKDFYTVHIGEFSYKELNHEYEYIYKVTKDLLYDYSCGWKICIPTKGIEVIKYRSDTENSVLFTDYGDGTCDNLATVTEYGVSYIIDFGDMWYSQGCDGTDCDTIMFAYD